MHQAFRLTFLFRQLRNVVLFGSVTAITLVTDNARGEWAEVQLKPEVWLTEKYQDQFTFSPNSFSIWETDFRAILNSRIKGDRWSVDFNNRYRGSRYVVHDELNRDDWKTGLVGEFKTQNLLWGLGGGYEKDNPSSAEADTDQEFTRITRNRWNIGPSVSWSLSDLTTLNATYNYSRTSFQNDEPTRDDFEVHSAALSAFRLLGKTTQIFTRLSYVGFFLTPRSDTSTRPGLFGDLVTVDETDSETEQIILEAGIIHAFSETFRLQISGGNNWLFSKQREKTQNIVTSIFGPPLLLGESVNNTSSNQNEFIFDASLTKIFEFSTLDAAVSRSVFPTFSGGQTERQQVTLTYTHRLTDTLKALVRANAFKNRTLENITNSESDRTRYTGEIKVNWNFVKNWELVGQYRYRAEDREGRASEDINTVQLSIRYRWSPLILFP